MRLACRTEDEASQVRPRRAALLPRAALALGVCLIVLALGLAARTVLTAPTGQDRTPPGLRTQAAVSAPSPAPGAQSLAPADPASPDGGPAQVVVHVAGAVAVPGVVVLRPGARVADAIDAAGGAAADADTDQLNLARPLSDGEQVRVPRAGEDASAWAQQPAGSGTAQAAGGQGGGDPAGAQGGQDGGLINLNTADAAALEELPGIGPALAERIVSHRGSHGPFATVEDLLDVPGIGQAKLEALRERATV